jgi:hypothetical protein
VSTEPPVMGVILFTPKAFHSTARGRAAHPPGNVGKDACYAEGVTHLFVFRITPWAYSLWGTHHPGCAAARRPRALGSNAFGVMNVGRHSTRRAKVANRKRH